MQSKQKTRKTLFAPWYSKSYTDSRISRTYENFSLKILKPNESDGNLDWIKWTIDVKLVQSKQYMIRKFIRKRNAEIKVN